MLNSSKGEDLIFQVTQAIFDRVRCDTLIYKYIESVVLGLLKIFLLTNEDVLITKA